MRRILDRLRPWLPTNWREFVSWGLLQIVTAIAFISLGMAWSPSVPPVPVWDGGPAIEPEPIKVYGQGWTPDPDAVADVAGEQPFERFADTPAFKAGDQDVDAYLWTAWIKAAGAVPPPRNQASVGACVGFGTTAAVDLLLAIKSARDGSEYHDTVQEAVYGGSRVQIGKGRLGGGDGSVGAWAAQWVRDYGVIARGKVGSYDLATYSESRCRQWGNAGCPKDLEAEAKLRPVKGITLCKSSAEVARALQSGYPVAVCSGQGFSSTRDAEGMARPQGSWAHCMAILGYRADRKAFFVWNSWGANWIKGPLGPGTPPEGGFWADNATIDRMTRAGDTWAFSDAAGWPIRKIDWFVWRTDRRTNQALARLQLRPDPWPVQPVQAIPEGDAARVAHASR